MEENREIPGAATPAPADRDASLAGMSASDAREYILGFITTLKLTEKEIASLEDEAERWKERAALASARGADDLFAEAEKEAEKLNKRLAALGEEARSLGETIARMRKQLPGLAARERSVDPDLLEQELLTARGYLPGDEEKARSDSRFGALEKEAKADAALEALKAKMEDTSH